MRRTSLLVTSLVLLAGMLALAVVGCGGTSTTTAPATTSTTAPATTTTAPATTTTAAGGDTVKLGALLDFTGPVADLGPMFEMGIKLALEEVNYTVAGKKIELIVEDTATSVDTAVLKAKKLEA